MTGFVKLDGNTLTSSLWVERDLRSVFLTALLMAEPYEIEQPMPQYEVRRLEKTGWVVPPGWYGIVRAAGTAIVRLDGVEQETGLRKLEELGAPDPDSRSQDFEGRRMVRIDGGYLILNYLKYRDRDYTAADRMRRLRARKKAEGPGVTANGDDVTANDTHAEGRGQNAEADPSTHHPAVAAFLAALPDDQSTRHWSAIIDGWQQGMGFEGGKAASADDVATGLTEYLATAKRDFAVIHVRSFVERARRNRLKGAARGNGQSSEEAARIWTLIKSQGIHHRTTQREIDTEVTALVTAGKVRDAGEFTTILKKLDFDVLRKAREESFAVKHIADRLNGAHLRVA